MHEFGSEGSADKAAEGARGKRVTGRSPMYPFFDLERSIARAQQLFDREKVHATPVMTALKHWGYTNSSGKAGMTLSALKQFGLLEDVGRGDDRRVQLTTRAYDILHTPHEEERMQLLQEAALTPEIHKALWSEYGVALPSNSSLAWMLTKERGFTSGGADDFIRQWKRTMQFAKLGEIQPDDRKRDPDANVEAEDHASNTSSTTRPEEVASNPLVSPGALYELGVSQSRPTASDVVQSYAIPIALQGRAPVIVTGPFPLSEVEWIQFTAVLAAMKPVLAGGEASGNQ